MHIQTMHNERLLELTSQVTWQGQMSTWQSTEHREVRCSSPGATTTHQPPRKMSPSISSQWILTVLQLMNDTTISKDKNSGNLSRGRRLLVRVTCLAELLTVTTLAKPNWPFSKNMEWITQQHNMIFQLRNLTGDVPLCTFLIKHSSAFKVVLQRTFFISTNEGLMCKFYKICNYFIFN